MSKEHQLLQHDMFTGDLVDNRTPVQKQADRQREKPQQAEMFSQRELAQFGVKARPLLPLSPHTRLVLIAEDPRTEEEKERDRERAAQKLTGHLFSEEVEQTTPEQVAPVLSAETLFSPADLPEAPAPIEQDEDDKNVLAAPVSQPLSKQAAYKELISLSEERAMTVYCSPAYALSQTIGFSLAILEAKRAGLNETEIATAITIGEFRGKTLKKRIGEDKPTRKVTVSVLPDYTIAWTSEGHWLEPSKI